ncbi:MAG TPA: OmpH family outer membrane protein [Gemmatimonadaceae bacterium]|nr:OmpH family outer membrane protein [Gemmatimonadaceae bacterium]
MRSFIRAALGALAFSVVSTGVAAAQGTPKIAYIRSDKIIAQAPGRAEAEAQIQKEMDTYREQVKVMGDSLNTLVAAYNKAEPTLSPAAKQGKQKEIQAKEAEYQQRAQELEQKAQQRQAELVGPVMQQINKVIEQIRAEDGYAMVFDAGNQAGVVVAADSSLDITDKVIARLKASAPQANATPAKPAGPTGRPAGATRPKNPPSER